MQDSDKNIISFNNESQPLLEKYQNNVISLQESIKKLEIKNQEIENTISKQEKEQNDLKIKLEKVGLEYSEKRNFFAKIKTFHSISELLISLTKITIRKFQKVCVLGYYKINKFLFKKNIKTIQKNQEAILELNNKISFISSQRQKGFELYKGQWLLPAEIQRRKEADIGIGDNFSSMSDTDFEYFIAALFSEMGYETKVIPLPDYGVDVVAKKDGRIYAIQCKKFNEKNPVSNKYIQQLLGAMDFYKAQDAIFVTTSTYTKNAIKQTKNSRIELWDKTILHEHIEKYLLKKESSEIIGLIEREKLKKTEKERAEERKLMEKRRIEQDKTICPRCLGGKRKNRKMCSKCKKELSRKPRRERGGKGRGRNFDFNPDYSGLSSINWNPYDR